MGTRSMPQSSDLRFCSRTMDSETSDETSSDYSTESSDDDGMETAEIDGTRLQLPQGLCEHKEIFDRIMSSSTWNSLSESQREHLQTFLPTFPENDDEEKSKTLQKLFDRESFRFENPLEKFHEHLKAGYFRPDIANMRRLIERIERQESQHRYKKYREKLRQDVIESQKKLLQQVNNLPPGVEPKCEKPMTIDPSLLSTDYVIHRTKRRYFQVLGSIQAKMEESYNSPDENYPEGPPVPLSRKQRRHLNSIRNAFTTANPDLFISTTSLKPNNLDLDKYVTPTRNPFYISDDSYKSMVHQHKRRKLEHFDDPEMNTKGITLNDVIGRTQLPFVKSTTSHHHHKNHTESKSRRKAQQQPTASTSSSKKEARIIGHSHSSNSEQETDSDSFIDAVTVNHTPPKPKRIKKTVVSASSKSKSGLAEVKKPTPPAPAPPEEAAAAAPSSTPPPPFQQISPTSVHQKQQQQQAPQQLVQSEELIIPSKPPPPPLAPPAAPPPPPPTPAVIPTPPPPAAVAVPTPPPPPPPPPPPSFPAAQYGAPVSISDLEGIDMMEIPIDLDNSDIDILELNNKPELMQDTHSNFLSLIRDVICSTNEHRMSLRTLEERLKLWQENPISPLNDWYSLCDNWAGLLKSAVGFLCGNSLEQPEDFVPYMEFKPALDMYQWIGCGRDSDGLLAPLCQYWLEHRNESKPSNNCSGIKTDRIEELDVEVSDRAQTPPPPRCPTTWTVRKATPEEVKDFREQERRRYDNPHKAFTYRCNGFESVVGPLKGIYNASVGNSKARGHTMLNADRPNFVTILSLVRDATARLPNGEGTRADICELLKSSQYISSSAPDNVLQSVVSGALDRMHTQFDPCVKYDPKRKIWIYLHRNRSEEDFERIHQQYQGVNKTKKAATKKPASAKPKTPKADKAKQVKEVQVTGAAAAAEKATPPKSAAKAAKVQVVAQTNDGAVISIANPTISPTKTNSLLITNQVGDLNSSVSKVSLVQQQKQQQHQQQLQQQQQTQEEKEINEALQAIVQNRVSSPTIKITASPTPTNVKTKNLVKIISPSQGGKSLIIPASSNAAAAQILKQVQEQQQQQRATPTKQLNQVVTQQLLLTAKQKQQAIQIVKQQQQQQNESGRKIGDKQQQQNINEAKVQTTQFIQSITPQQLQNIKNVTLVRNVAPGDGTTRLGATALPEQIQIKTQAALTPAQQQQIIQTLKQKIFTNSAVLNAQQPQHIILKQKPTAAAQKGQIGAGVTPLGTQQAKIIVTEGPKGGVTATQTPVVAKVLTNAAGQVISVESLLAHQKQHGSLPQGTTLRVSGTKGGQTNIIQLTGATGSNKNPLAQFVTASSNNIIAITSQPKLVVSTQAQSLTTTLAAATTLVTTTASTTTLTTSIATKTIARSSPTTGVASPHRIIGQQSNVVTSSTAAAQAAAKFAPKIHAQQLINAKLMTAAGQTVDGQAKIVHQPKIFAVGGAQQSQQVKLTAAAAGKNISLSKPMTLTNANTIRMVNAANLNLTHIGGKPVLLASKGLQGQNVILQPNTSAGSLVLQNAVKGATIPSTTNILGQHQNVVLGPQLKVQGGTQQVVFSSGAVKGTGAAGTGGTATVTAISQGQHIVLEGQTVRLQTSTATANTQRVVLASQGQGGQIVAQQFLLPAGFQGTAINIKALQGVKVIPLQQGRGLPNRQVFARVMSPAVVKAAVTTSSPATTEKPPDPPVTSPD